MLPTPIMSLPIIRSARPEDAAPLAAIYAPYVASTAISFEIVPPTADQMQERVATVQAHAPWLVCELKGAVAGYAYASRHRDRAAYQWSLDCAVYVGAGHHRKGVGRALYTTLFALVRLQGYCAVHAGITLPNTASVALHESLGFQKVGVYASVGYKLGAWHDVGWWQRELRDRSGAPAPLLSPSHAEGEHPREWTAALKTGEQLLESSAL